MAIGIETNFITAASVPFTTNVVPATVGLLSPLAANQTQHFKAQVFITVGATGGFRLVIAAPAGAVVSVLSLRVNNTVTPTTTPSIPVINVASTNALASAGTHWLDVEGTITNGAVAGSIDLQFAQNTSDALTLTVLRGSFMNITKL
jgi:hypothetical protein